jgi:hypothetical protein
VYDSICDNFTQALVCVGDSHILSEVADSQPLVESKVAVTPVPTVNGPVADLVAQVPAELAARLASTKKRKNISDADKALKASQKENGTMKWLPFMSSFVLVKMCALIRTRVRTDKGFKEVHLTVVANAMFEHCGINVSSTQVYNHLRKWRQRCLTISRFRNLSGDGIRSIENKKFLPQEQTKSQDLIYCMVATRWDQLTLEDR